MNIILTGLRGSGKSGVGKYMAKKLGWNFIDTDCEIENKEGMPISKIVELHGWEYFRAKENEIAKKIATRDQCIISTGGGMIIDRENEKILKKNGKIIYLYVNPEICAARIKKKSNRPPITNAQTIEEEMQQIYVERNGRYCKSAFMVFERTDDRKKDAEEIVKALFEA